jgi:hypothetical protein
MNQPTGWWCRDRLYSQRQNDTNNKVSTVGQVPLQSSHTKNLHAEMVRNESVGGNESDTVRVKVRVVTRVVMQLVDQSPQGASNYVSAPHIPQLASVFT